MAQEKKTLYRIPREGQIFGVCAGLAEYFDMDVTLMRIIFIILIFATGGAMILIYLLMAIVLPIKNNEKDDNIGERVHNLGQELHKNKVVNRTRNYLGIGLLVLGVWLLIEQIFPGWFNLRWDYIWPVLIILAGLLIIVRRSDG